MRRDAYKEGTRSATSTYFQPGSVTNAYDGAGNLTAVTDATSSANNRSFVNDAAGRILLKSQNGATERQLVVNGEVLAYFKGTSADFKFGYAPISGSYPAAVPGAYTVTSEDSLQSIAKAAYGDSSLWYRIAEANGMTSDRDLRVGQTLTVPAQVNSANSASSFQPYDPSEIIGDTTPNMPNPPPKKKGCGFFGKLIMVVVAAFVTFFAPQALPALKGLGAVGYGIAAGLGSIASQAVGNMLGIVDGFSWKAVALAAISGGVTKGLEGAGWLPDVGNQFANTAIRYAVGNAITQGIGVMTGLQKKFDWRGVAASAAGSFVGDYVGDKLGGAFKGVLGDQGADIARRALTGLAVGLTASVMRGGKIVTTQLMADAFGNAIGSSLAQETNSTSSTSDYRHENEFDKGGVQRVLNEGAGNGFRSIEDIVSNAPKLVPDMTPEMASTVRSEMGYRPLQEESWVVADAGAKLMSDSKLELGGFEGDSEIAARLAFLKGMVREQEAQLRSARIAAENAAGNRVNKDSANTPIRESETVISTLPSASSNPFFSIDVVGGGDDLWIPDPTGSGGTVIGQSPAGGTPGPGDVITSAKTATLDTIVEWGAKQPEGSAWRAGMGTLYAITDALMPGSYGEAAVGAIAGPILGKGVAVGTRALNTIAARSSLTAWAAADLPGAASKALGSVASRLGSGRVANSAESLASIRAGTRSADGLSNLNGRDLAAALDGQTLQSTKIAQGIKNGDIKVSVLGDELFERMVGKPDEVAAAIGNKIYLRRSSGSLLSDTVHEGTHALDYLNGFGLNSTKTTWQWEKRAFFYEHQFQLSTGVKPDFNSQSDMMFHIWSNYKNDIFNPYP